MYRNKRYKGALRSSVLLPTTKSAQQLQQSQNNDENLFENVEEPLIPSSQPDGGARYLSQRNAIRTQSNLHITVPNNSFENILLKCECDFKSSNSYVILTTDHISFTRSLRLHLKSTSLTQGNLNSFLEGFTESFTLIGKEAESSMKYLNGCLINSGPSKQPAQSQTSPIKCLLSIDFLQKSMAKILLEKLKEYIVKMQSNINLTTVTLLLQQFKFSNQVFDREMYDDIFAIFELTSSLDCKEIIIGSFLDIIPLYHDDAVKKLLAITTNDREFLTPNTLSTLVLMDLHEDTVFEVHNRIKNFLKGDATMVIYPSMVKFLLMETNSIPMSVEIIDIIRKCISWDNCDQFTDQEIKRSKVNVFQHITKALRRSKILFDCWFKIIANSPTQKFIDFLVLLIMLDVREEKFTAINSLLKQKLRKGFYGVSFLETNFNQFGMIISKHSSRFLELIEIYFRDKNEEINLFAASCFKLFFAIPDTNKKSLIIKLIGLICEKSAKNHLPFAIHSDYKTNSLMILRELDKAENSLDLINNLHELLKILDYSVELNTHQFRLALDILCSLSYSAKTSAYSNDNHKEAAASVREHLKMMVNKLIGSRIHEYKKQGVIAIVKIVGSLVLNSPEMTFAEVDSLDIKDIPEGPAREAAELVDLLFSGIKDSEELLGLSYDEFSLEFSNKRKRIFTMHPIFLCWFKLRIHDSFEQHFVVLNKDIKEQQAGGIKLKLLYNFNANVEDGGIGVDIGQKVFAQNQVPNESAALIAPIFKLLRNLNYISHRNLTDINALLGCSIVLPDNFQQDNINLYDDYNEETGKKVLDCYFHCCNWLREIIGAFIYYCTQKNNADKDELLLSEIVCRRVIQLIKIERRIPELIKTLQTSNYVQPPADFMNIETNKKILESLMKTKKSEKTAPKNPAKRQKKNSNAEPNETVADPDNDVNATIHPNTQAQALSLNKIKALDVDELPRELYRSMDPDILWLLTETFNFEETTTDSNNRPLGLIELKFILDDMIHKSEVILKSSSKRMSSEFTIEPENFVECIGRSFKKIMKFMWEVNERIKKLIRKALDDGNEDVLYTPYANSLKGCLNSSLKLLSVIFSWKSFIIEKHRSLLKKCLFSFVDQKAVANEFTFKDLCDFVIKNFLRYEPSILDVKSAVYLIDIVQTISKFKMLYDEVVDANDDKQLLHDTAERFLEKEWYSVTRAREQGVVLNPCLDIFLKYYVTNIDMEALDQQISELQGECVLLKKKDNYLKQYPSINRLNVLHLFRAYFSQVNHFIEEKSSNMNLGLWEKLIVMISRLLEISKIIGLNNIFSTFVKYSQQFISLFIQHGLPVIDKFILRDTERIIKLMAGLQKVTKFLHTLVCQSKKIKNKIIIAQIPHVRQLLQNLLYKVQSILAANNCTSAMKVWYLIPKDLQDQVMSNASQPSTAAGIENDEMEYENRDEIDDDTGSDLDELINARDQNSSGRSHDSVSTVI